MAISFSGGRSRSTQRELPTMDKQLVSFITCDCESSAPFCNLQIRARTHVILVIGLYELLGNPTTQLIEPPGPSRKDRQHNDRQKQDKETNNDLQNITHKIKDGVTRTLLIKVVRTTCIRNNRHRGR